MAHYSVATTKDRLSTLIDRALQGEEVIVTRRGRPTVQICAVETGERHAAKDAIHWLGTHSALHRPVGVTSIELKRLEEEDAR